ncbi:MAG: hypothetical protein Q7V00_09810 [Sulfurimicrobium sp.]|nr:hypothetical protein [Sulfurimicrobium sp.]MDP1705700.1 hypothetical protein [Sulfurimicrobium sp.]MDP2200280.1 hypothetical protein [Sulfurimicrobium sp.]
MNQPAGLSLDQAPPITVPLRFFLSAPLFSMTAAILLLWQGPDMLMNRWHPALLGATHMLTLGFLGLIMMGAVMQMLPVVAGTPVRHPLWSAAIIHTLGVTGIVLMCFGLVSSSPSPLRFSLPLLGSALLMFSSLVIFTLRRAQANNMTARAIRLAAVMLAATAILGLLLLSNHAYFWWLEIREPVTNLHLSWGLLGWVGVLVVGVAFQVVPMFQLTPAYPAIMTRWLAIFLFLLLLALSLGIIFPSLQLPLGLALACALIWFAVTTLRLQNQRKRKLPDVTLSFWFGGMLCLLLAIALWLAGQVIPPGENGQYELLLGLLMIVGFAMSLVNGMLYKIVPFLVWFHLQSRRKPGGPVVPNVKQILPEKRTRRQMWLHFAALASLLAAVLRPALFFYPAAVLFGASSFWLWLNMLSAWLTYRRIDALIVLSREASSAA